MKANSLFPFSAALPALLVCVITSVGSSSLLAADPTQASSKVGAEGAGAKEPVVQMLNELIKSAEATNSAGRDTNMLREILERASARVGSDLKDRPHLGGQLRNTIGEGYLKIGELQKAEAMFRDAAMTLGHASTPEQQLEMARALANLTRIRIDQKKFSEAEALCRESLVIRRNLLGTEHPAVMTSLPQLADILRKQGKLDEAEAVQRQILAARKKLFGPEHAAVAESLSGLANVLKDQGKLAEAEAVEQESKALQRKLNEAK